MHDILIALVAVVLFLSPCIVASRCASERRTRMRRRSIQPYTGANRRDPR